MISASSEDARIDFLTHVRRLLTFIVSYIPIDVANLNEEDQPQIPDEEEDDIPIILGFGAMGVNLKVLPTFVEPMLSNLITLGAEIKN